jgi:hypothetical protein
MCSEFEIEVNVKYDKLLEPVSSGKFRSVVIKRNIADSYYIYILAELPGVARVSR